MDSNTYTDWSRFPVTDTAAPTAQVKHLPVIVRLSHRCLPACGGQALIYRDEVVGIRLLDGPHECRTVRLSEEVTLNIGAGEKLVGIEILDVKEVLGSGKLPFLAVENLPLADATSAATVVREKPVKKYGK